MVINVCSKMEVENNMSEEEATYPVKSLHDFLVELDKEWDKFRTASLIGMIISGVLLVFFIIRFLGLLLSIRIGARKFLEVIDDFAFQILVAVFIIYEISLLLRQYRFFSKWEQRIGSLLRLEERLMEGKEQRT